MPKKQQQQHILTKTKPEQSEQSTVSSNTGAAEDIFADFSSEEPVAIGPPVGATGSDSLPAAAPLPADMLASTPASTKGAPGSPKQEGSAAHESTEFERSDDEPVAMGPPVGATGSDSLPAAAPLPADMLASTPASTKGAPGSSDKNGSAGNKIPESDLSGDEEDAKGSTAQRKGIESVSFRLSGNETYTPAHFGMAAKIPASTKDVPGSSGGPSLMFSDDDKELPQPDPQPSNAKPIAAPLNRAKIPATISTGPIGEDSKVRFAGASAASAAESAASNQSNVAGLINALNKLMEAANSESSTASTRKLIIHSILSQTHPKLPSESLSNVIISYFPMNLELLQALHEHLAALKLQKTFGVRTLAEICPDVFAGVVPKWNPKINVPEPTDNHPTGSAVSFYKKVSFERELVDFARQVQAAIGQLNQFRKKPPVTF